MDEGVINLWDVAKRELIATLEGHTDDINSVAFSPNGTLPTSTVMGASISETFRCLLPFSGAVKGMWDTMRSTIWMGTARSVSAIL